MFEQRRLAYGLIFDNLLDLTLVELTRLFNLYALLYEGIVCSDSWIVTNGALQQILSRQTGHLLVQNGVIVFARRNSVTSFADFLELARGRKMHGLTASDQFVASLDAMRPGIIEFSLEQVGAAYRRFASQVLEPEFLHRLGVSEPAAEQVQWIIRTEAQMGVDVHTNTFIKDVVCPQLREKADADLVMEAARAPYGLNLPNVLGTGMVGPRGFRGDMVLAALRGQARSVGAVDIGSSDAIWATTFSDPMVSWLVNEQLGDLTPEELILARSGSRRQDYLTALGHYMTLPGPQHWQELTIKLEAYLREAGTAVFKQRSAQGATADPTVGEVECSGEAASVRLVPNSGTDPVRLNLLEAGTGGVQVVGRTYEVPTPDTN